MKKLCLLIVVALACVIALSTYGKEQTKTYEGNANDEYVLTSITYKDDKVLKQSTINTVRYGDLGMDKDEAKKLFTKSEGVFKNLKGVKYKVGYKDEKAVGHLNINYTEVDMKKSNKRLSVSTKENKDISFERLEEQLKHRGLEEKGETDNK